jgi:4-oxalocrotonate tautomerase
MPMIEVTLGKGRSPEQLKALGQALTAATVEAIGAKPESVRVILRECDPDHWFVGGESMTELRAAGKR